MNQPTAIERITTLEANQEHMATDITEIKGKVDEMHNMLMQAKGARWAVVAIAGAAGMVTGALAKVFPFLPGK